MVEANEEKKINENLYSRQIGTFGIEMMQKLQKIKVLIMGCRGLGVETAKNLILTGPESVSIYDPTIVSIADLGANFYLKDSDVGNKTRAEASIDQLKELNPYVQTEVVNENQIEVDNFDVVCITENLMGINKLIELNEKCRQKGKGFILSENMGLASYVFVDFGAQHTIFDKNGEPTRQLIVSGIARENHPKVFIHEDSNVELEDGDYVKFSEVEGMTQLNELSEPIQIDNVGPLSFNLKLDTSNFDQYTRQGIVQDVKVSKTVSYKSLDESIYDPAACSEEGLLQLDMTLMGLCRSEQLHIAIHAVHLFHFQNQRYPQDTPGDLDQVVELANKFNERRKE